MGLLKCKKKRSQDQVKTVLHNGLLLINGAAMLRPWAMGVVSLSRQLTAPKGVNVSGPRGKSKKNSNVCVYWHCKRTRFVAVPIPVNIGIGTLLEPESQGAR